MGIQMEIKSLAQLIFAAKYPCIVTKENSAMIKEVPVELPPPPQVQVFGGRDTITGVIVEEVEGDVSGLLDMLYCRPIVTQDMETFPELGILEPDSMILPISSIADIVGIGGAVTLTDPNDSIEIYETISSYLTMVEEKGIYEPHYRRPPEEDLLLLGNLKDMISAMVYICTKEEAGSIFTDDFISATSSNKTMSNTGMILGNIDKVINIGGGQNGEYNPYSFPNLK